MIQIVKQLKQLSADSVQFTFLHLAEALFVPLYFRTQINLQNASDNKL